VQFDPVRRDALLPVQWIEEQNAGYCHRNALGALPLNRATEKRVDMLAHGHDTVENGTTLRA